MKKSPDSRKIVGAFCVPSRNSLPDEKTTVPELPDIMVYIEALERTVLGQQLEGIRIASPFLVRSIAPPMESFAGRPVSGCNRLGKRIVMEFDGDYFLVLHLMIAGRIRWKKRGAGLPGRIGLAAFDFPNGTLLLTEAGSKRRASLYAVRPQRSLENRPTMVTAKPANGDGPGRCSSTPFDGEWASPFWSSSSEVRI